MGSMLTSVVPETDIEGYQILYIHKNSPAEKAGLEAFFDFVVALCGIVLVGTQNVFLNLVKKNLEIPIDLKVYSTRTNTFRNVRITPSSTWGGQGLLGLTINYCSVKEAQSFIHHVLEVHPNSPADIAGLRSFSDYIFGVEAEQKYDDLDFMNLVKEYNKKNLKLFVYNVDNNSSRSVIIQPDNQWRGNGALGCDIASGYLHRIPVPMLPSVENKLASIENTKTVAPTLPTTSIQSTVPAVKMNYFSLEIKNENVERRPMIPASETTFKTKETLA